jgi:protein N-terminal methyltransferase
VLLEPVPSFIKEGHRRCQGTSTSDESSVDGWTGISDRTKSVSFFKAPLQSFDPARPKRNTEELQRLGYVPGDDDSDLGFDIVWCQWCLGHLNDEDLVTFLKRSAAALRDPTSLIVVKENLCSEKKAPRTVFDDRDSSWTRYAKEVTLARCRYLQCHRSDLAFKQIFEDAGLDLVRQKIQRGLPMGLYPVKMYVMDNIVRRCFTDKMSYRYALRPSL